MNAHKPIPAAVPLRSTAGGLIAPAVSSPATYSYRMIECPECEGSGLISTEWRDGWTGSETCRDCRGSGEADASCCDCGEDRPLNSDGECEQCSDGRILTTDQWNAKHLCGWALAERSALR